MSTKKVPIVVYDKGHRKVVGEAVVVQDEAKETILITSAVIFPNAGLKTYGDMSQFSIGFTIRKEK